MNDLISRKRALEEMTFSNGINVDGILYVPLKDVRKHIKNLPSAQSELCEDAVSRKDAIRWVKTECNPYGKPTLDFESGVKVMEYLKRMPSAKQVVRCKDCQYGIQDEYDQWYCRSLGCSLWDEDGNGFCSDAERRTE